MLQQSKLKAIIAVLIVLLIVVSFSFVCYYTITETNFYSLGHKVQAKNQTIDNLTNLSQELQSDLLLARTNTSLMQDEISLLELNYGVNIQVFANNVSVTVAPSFVQLVGAWMTRGNDTLLGSYSTTLSDAGTTGVLGDNNTTDMLQVIVNTNPGQGATWFLHKFRTEELELFFNNTGYDAVSFSYSTFLIWGN